MSGIPHPVLGPRMQSGWVYHFIASSTLNSTAPLTLTRVTKMMCCWLTAHLVDLLGPPGWLVCSCCCWMELVWYKTLHSFLFMKFLSAHSPHYLKSLKIAGLSSSCQLLPFVPLTPSFLPRQTKDYSRVRWLDLKVASRVLENKLVQCGQYSGKQAFLR